MTASQQINRTSLSHPRTQWEIEACMRMATEESRVNVIGASVATSATGREIVTIVHNRTQVPAFSFYRDGKNVTAEFLAALRAL